MSDDCEKPTVLRLDGINPIDMDAITKPMRDAVDAMMAPSRQLGETVRRMQESMVVPGLAETMAEFSAPAINPELSAILGRIGSQKDMIESLRQSQPSLDDLRQPRERFDPIGTLKLPPNPAWETNQRLERIENQFEAMRTIATEGAQIATSLQAYAAQFLSRFEQAANETDRSARKAVKISFWAIVLTAGAALLPIAYDLAWQSRGDAAAQLESLAAVEAVRDELAGLRADQGALFERLDATLASTDADAVPVLEEIRELLRQLPPANQIAPEPVWTQSPADAAVSAP